MKPFLLLTGMHRSGTSFLARALNLYGVHLGELESLLSHEWKAFDDNPRGHWENKKIYELAEKTLQENKGSWHNIPKNVIINKKMGKEIKKYTQQLVDNSVLASGFKDPRLLLCFEAWKKYLPKNFVIIGIIRNPLKVAESLKKRNNFSYEKSLKLWEIYNKNLIEILEKYDGFLVDFDWPKKKLFTEIEFISKKLGLAKNIDLSDWYTKDLLKSDKSFKSKYPMSKDVQILYSKLKKRSMKNRSAKIKKPKLTSKEMSNSLENVLLEIQNQGKYFTDIFNHIQKKLKQDGKKLSKLEQHKKTYDLTGVSNQTLQQSNKKLVKLQKEFDERSKWALSLDDELKQKRQEIVNLQKEHEEHSAHAINLENKIKKSDETITRLQKVFDERSKWALSLDDELKQKRQEIVNLQKEHEEHSAHAINLENKIKKSDETITRLQKEFDERSKWSLSLEEDLKQKHQEFVTLKKESDENAKRSKEAESVLKQREESITKLKKEYNESSKEVTIIQKSLEDTKNAIQTKDSQIQNLQSELEIVQSELAEIKNSVMYGITSGIARKLDKLAPESTRRRNSLQLTSAAYLMRKERGTKAVMGVAKEKISLQKLLGKKSSKANPKDYLKTIKEKKTKFSSNILQADQTTTPDQSLRNFIQFGAHNITALEKFPKISIIIITYNQLDALKRNLSSIKSKTTYQNYEVIIVTNNKDENSEMRKFLKTLENPVYVFDEEYSFGGMNNFGATKAKGDFLLFLNDDVEVVSPNWLESFMKLAQNSDVGAVGAKLLSSNGKLQDCGGIVWGNGNAWNYGRNYSTDDPKFNYVRDIDYCSGSCLLVKKEVFDKLGGFDRKFDPAYWEDTDLCFGIRNLGYRILYQPLATLIHYEGMTQGVNPDKGLKSFQAVNQKKFQEKWKSEIESHLNDSQENSFLERDRRAGLNILYIDHYVPEPDKDSGSLRTFNILGILAHSNNKITFWPENQKFTSPFVRELQQKGIEVIYKTNDFEKFLDERKNVYDIVIMARPYISVKFIDSIKEKMPNCKIIYDTIDLHFLRMEREAAIENKGQNAEAKVMQKLELSMMKKSDLTILTSSVEAQVLHKEDESLKFAILPNIHTEISKVDGFDSRKNMLFLGGFQHSPNIDSAKYLVSDIWPLIRQKIPDVKLYIVGSSPTPDIKNLASEDVEVTGFVKDLLPYYKECKVMLAPLRYGAGVKGKITQSLAMGLPIITTSFGAEGINLNDGDSCLIADSKEDFAKKSIQAYNDKTIWEKLSKNGLEISRQYCPENARATLEEMISSIF